MNREIITLLNKTDGRLSQAITGIGDYNTINEIRVRRGRRVSLTVSDDNILTDVIADDKMVIRLFDELCRGSVYAHMETLRSGYIILESGIRAGVCGRAVTENGIIKNVYAIDSINIRIPNPVYGICGKIYDRIAQNGFYLNVLIYSVPGAGKTTMLRDIAYDLAIKGNRRVVIIDSRCEIADERLKYCENTDIMYAYPKAEAIEIATRTMNPQYLVCDEIGSYVECEALLSAQNSGVPVVTTAHASNVKELMRRKNIYMLHEHSAFDLYVGLRRSGQKTVISFCTADEVLKN